MKILKQRTSLGVNFDKKMSDAYAGIGVTVAKDDLASPGLSQLCHLSEQICAWHQEEMQSYFAKPEHRHQQVWNLLEQALENQRCGEQSGAGKRLLGQLLQVVGRMGGSILPQKPVIISALCSTALVVLLYQLDILVPSPEGVTTGVSEQVALLNGDYPLVGAGVVPASASRAMKGVDQMTRSVSLVSGPAVSDTRSLHNSGPNSLGYDLVGGRQQVWLDGKGEPFAGKHLSIDPLDVEWVRGVGRVKLSSARDESEAPLIWVSRR